MPDIKSLKVIDHAHVDDIIRSVEALSGNRVMVGVPDTTAGRRSGPITNASIAYVQNFGSPRENIPAREFMYSGIANVRDRLIGQLKRAADFAIMGAHGDTIKALNAIGLTAQNAIRAKITAGPFQALSPRTIAERRRPGRLTNYGLIAGRVVSSTEHANVTGIRPLIDTGQLRRSITYVLRGRWF